MQHGKELANR